MPKKKKDKFVRSYDVLKKVTNKTLDISAHNEIPFEVNQHGTLNLGDVFSFSADGLKCTVKSNYDFRPIVQRDVCWGLVKWQKLIASIIDGIDIGSVTVNYRDESYRILDGLQRFTTLLKFFNNEFSAYYHNSAKGIAYRFTWSALCDAHNTIVRRKKIEPDDAERIHLFNEFYKRIKRVEITKKGYNDLTVAQEIIVFSSVNSATSINETETIYCNNCYGRNILHVIATATLFDPNSGISNYLRSKIRSRLRYFDIRYTHSILRQAFGPDMSDVASLNNIGETGAQSMRKVANAFERVVRPNKHFAELKQLTFAKICSRHGNKQFGVNMKIFQSAVELFRYILEYAVSSGVEIKALKDKTMLDDHYASDILIVLCNKVAESGDADMSARVYSNTQAFVDWINEVYETRGSTVRQYMGSATKSRVLAVCALLKKLCGI